MLKVKQGDLDKLGLLFERYHRGLYGYFYRLCKDQQICEDLIQAVFERLLKYRHSYTGNGKFSTWLFSIARNQFIDHYHMMKKNGFTVPIDETQIENQESAEYLDQHKAKKKEILEMALNELHPEKREVIILSRYEGLRYKEIAEILGTTEGAVKVKMFRAMNELKDLVMSFEKQKNYE